MGKPHSVRRLSKREVHDLAFACRLVNAKDCKDVWSEYERVKGPVA